MSARYMISSLTGYPIGAYGEHAGPESTEWYVLDTLVNHKVVDSFEGAGAVLRAALRCEALNEQHAMSEAMR